MQRRSTAVLFATIVPFLTAGLLGAQCAHAAAVAAETPTPSLTASGTAKVQRTPDYVRIVCGVTITGATASEAQSKAMATMEAATKAVKGLSLAEEYLESDRVQLAPVYKRDSGYEVTREIIGYNATITMVVRSSDLQCGPRVIDAALSAGCNSIESLEFGVKEALAAREEAIGLAAKAAKRKAEVLAGALGLQLVAITSADTTAPQGSWGANRYSNMMAQSASSDGGGEGHEEGFNPGMVEIWATVNVTYSVK